MKRFVAGESRSQTTLFPELLDDFVTEDNPVRAIEAFVNALDLKQLGFKGVDPHATGRPAYHPAVLLKSISTATSTACNPAAVWNVRRSVMLNSCG